MPSGYQRRVMADLLPSSPSAEALQRERDPRVIGVDSDDADDLLSALSSGTARKLLAELHEEPTTPSNLAERADTSVQNAQYHLGKLADAGLIEVVDTIYSEKGREMKVYAPTDRPLIVFAGPEEESTGLRDALARVLGAVGILGVVSYVVQRLLAAGGSDAAGGPGVMSVQTAESAGGAAGAASALPPGLVFFAGGLLVLALAVVWRYLEG